MRLGKMDLARHIDFVDRKPGYIDDVLREKRASAKREVFIFPKDMDPIGVILRDGVMYLRQMTNGAIVSLTR